MKSLNFFNNKLCMNMKHSIYIIILIITASIAASAQYIRIERTDVDSSRSTFITASYKFGFDIYAQDMANCNGVALEMRYTKKDFIRYSGYDAGDFKNINITVLNDVDYVRVIVNASSGLQADNNGIDNPMIVHLEFVVLQSAPDFELDELDAEFTFLAPIATYFDDAGIQSVFLEANPVIYKIHGFINVWPGDTDNNGIVDYLDYEPINRFMSLGSKSKNMRSFKRKNPSSIWVPQRVLKWDSAMVTYADCDGNADITMQDALIVTYNLNKTHDIVQSGGIINQNNDYFLEDIAPKVYSDFTTTAVPVHISSPYQVLAVSGSLSLINNDKFKLIGIENGEMFEKMPYLLEYSDNGVIQFAVGSNDIELNADQSGVLINAVCKKVKDTDELPIIDTSELIGITNNGDFVALNSATSVVENNNTELFEIHNDFLLYTNLYIADNIEIFNIYGSSIYADRYITPNRIISLDNFSNGVYFISVTIDGRKYIQKFNLVK